MVFTGIVALPLLPVFLSICNHEERGLLTLQSALDDIVISDAPPSTGKVIAPGETDSSAAISFFFLQDTSDSIAIKKPAIIGKDLILFILKMLFFI
jgi:hypothetical protein